MTKLISNYKTNKKYLAKYYKKLVSLTKKKNYVGANNEWLIDNYHVLLLNDAEVKKTIKISDNVYQLNNYNQDLLKTIEEVLEDSNYKVNINSFINKLKTKGYEYTYKELNMLTTIILFILVNKVSDIYHEESSNISDLLEAKKIRKKLLQEQLNSFKNYKKYTRGIEKRPVFLENIVYLIQEMDSSSQHLLAELNDYLETKGTTIKEMLNNIHQQQADNNIIIINIWTSLNELLKAQITTVYNKLSNTEQLLKQDKMYKQMDDRSKEIYRQKIIKLAKRLKIEEEEFVEKLIKKSKDDEKHIGFYLFKTPNIKLRTTTYMGAMLSFTVLLTLALTVIFIPQKILGFFLLLLPCNELVFQILNNFLLRHSNPDEIVKLDYDKGIPNSSAVMIVMPTIVKNKEKVISLFKTLETYYLSNIGKNVHFTLLADGKENKEEHYEFDDEINQAGLDECLRLNKKYGRDIFFFIHRRRFYNKNEGSWLGIERKRGALNHFNLTLLNKLTKEEKQKYFQVQNLDTLKSKIKYVITLDTDTQLVVNTVSKLVGAMDHPLNTPVLNKTKTKVVSGYGIMQPKISLDIESTNRSIYSQLFVGIGGFDIYNRTTPNLYQDIFKEGSFVGKGIYNLETYDQVLTNAFPDNLILSHDLVEGNYLRCAYLSDIELYDDFPSKYLTDAMRKHRWARGDTQISGWMFKKVRNARNRKVNNPFNFIEKWKIFDNLRRSFLDFSYLLIIIAACFLNAKTPVIFPILVLIIILLPILYYFLTKINYRAFFGIKRKRYRRYFYGSIAVFLRCLTTFALIPYNAFLYLDATIRSLYRMLISKKKLLNWITAEEAEKMVKNNLSAYFKRFLINYIVGIIFIVLGLVDDSYTIIIFGLLFMGAPLLLYWISKEFNENKNIEKKKEEVLTKLAYDTWKYFDDLLTDENNYLIPDNYQLNREEKVGVQTSPTNIGMSILSIISAYEFKFITLEKALSLLNSIISTVEELDKWNGHLYNWYLVDTKEKLYPFYISSVDSANFVASLYTLKSFAEQHQDKRLRDVTHELIKNTNFSLLYTEEDVFSIGYNTLEEKLSPFNYNKFASESRILSYIGIASLEAPVKHWFCLDKTITSYKREKGLTSWAGTSFEYFMPLIFMRNYKNTLLDESYNFAVKCQKDYINSINTDLPWGISESAYAEYEDNSNYKYKTFGTPHLKLQNKDPERIVISPYASLIAVDYAKDIVENIEKYQKIDMYNQYGLLEAYDYTKKTPVKAYFAHHQGMILASLANHLKNDAIQNYFHENVEINTFEILLKEKAQIKCHIDKKINKYKSYDYEKEDIQNDIRQIKSLSARPEISVISNGKYALLINERGNGFSRYRTTQLNRYRKITEQAYGMLLYFKDLNNNKVWSNTYAPMNVKPDDYEAIFATDKIKFINKTNEITTTTEIVVGTKHNSEIRKYTFYNNSDEIKKLQLTTYNEPTIGPNSDDIAHRTYQNLFVKTEYNDQEKFLVSSREKENKIKYVVNKLYSKKQDLVIEYETTREKFIGRNRNTDNPVALENDNLTNTYGDGIDPVMSLRTTIELKPQEKQVIYFVNGYSRSMDQVKDLVRYYNKGTNLEKAFELANIKNNMNTKLLNLHGAEMRLYNIMLNYLYQTSRLNVPKARTDIMKNNTLSQESLWKFGISGDRPLILVNVNEIKDIGLIKELLKAYEYFKSRSLFIDLVIVNNNILECSHILEVITNETKYKIENIYNIDNNLGNINIIEKDQLTEEEVILLQEVARLNINSEEYLSLYEYIANLQGMNVLIPYRRHNHEKTIKYEVDNLEYYNGYGGFANEGKEYIINNPNTPTPWSNVLANKTFGSIVTNNANGYTYYGNSREFKISSWTNDIVVDDKSEGIKVNGKHFNPSLTTHGFGYSTFTSQGNDYEGNLTEFVHYVDNIKYYLFKLKNISKETKKYTLNFWMNPVLGVTEEKTARHIYSEMLENENALLLRNVYNKIFGNVNILMTSSEKITDYSYSKVLIRSINIEVELEPGKEKEISFMIKATTDNITFDKSIKAVKKELLNTKKYWHDTLSTIQVKTPDSSLDYMLNGWYLYQALACRIYAKSGFYQVGGAYGYRDQLQDASNLTNINPETSKKQILNNATHQFKEGDVLHWWHKELSFGLRSRYKDDYLWLVYATLSYIEKTEDLSILDEQVPFVEGEELQEFESEKGMPFTYSNYQESLKYHMFLALEKSMNSLGKHGIPLMGGGDWNDGMNKVGIEGKGESVWLGFFLHLIIDKLVNVFDKFEIEYDKNKYVDFNFELKKDILNNCYDKEYYLRAFFDNGDKLGSIENDECKIDLLSQSFAILSEVATKEQVKSILKNTESTLVDKETKIIKLLTPAFKNSKNNPGYIKHYPVGIRENGGQYTHSVAWYIMALCQAKEHDKAYEYYQMINPVNRTTNQQDTDTYALEPYVIAADIYTNERYKGRGGWNWYTGSAAWFYRVGIEIILGFNKKGNKLTITPHIPKHFNQYEITYKYQDTTYHITVNNKKETSTEYIVDGKKTDFIALINDKKQHEVVVNLAKEINYDQIGF